MEDLRIPGREVLHAELAGGRPVSRREPTVLWFRLLFDSDILIDTLETVKLLHVVVFIAYIVPRLPVTANCRSESQERYHRS